MTRRLSSGRPARSARPVIDAHGHLLVPEANALAEGHPSEAADAAAERASFTEASIAANQAQIRRVWPQLTEVALRLADLDAIGVDAQIVGPMPMHRYWAEPELAVKLTTVINEALPRTARTARAGCTDSAPSRCSTRRSPCGSLSAPSVSSASRESASPPTSTAVSSPTRSSSRSGRPPPTSARSSSSIPGDAASAPGWARTSSATPSASRPRRRWRFRT